MLRCSVFEFSTLPTWRLWSSGTCNQTANLRPDQLMPSQSQFTANIPDRWPIICFDCEFQTSRPEGKGSTTIRPSTLQQQLTHLTTHAQHIT
ncbi:hypothetical protein IAQ61_008690 [Plenodomus lingam]|uniref:uncharacterized protein n=1 Tax=Leptosphaeria maculans TaxID=5022 RepID=UPI00331BEBCF|nr:hypothetical protein IAQ61_008690 [Plenodomus lingam]